MKICNKVVISHMANSFDHFISLSFDYTKLPEQSQNECNQLKKDQSRKIVQTT